MSPGEVRREGGGPSILSKKPASFPQTLVSRHSTSRKEVRVMSPPASRAGHAFGTADDAAIAALDEVLTLSIENNWEYAGCIFRMTNGKYSFTRAVTDKKADDSTAELSPPPAGTTKVGTYHTHAGNFELTDEQFSP